ncbi:MAG: hypothetical protein DELT_00073 [Desulfovibrio sp.]
MPIYEYHCDACDTVFEEIHPHIDDVVVEPCPKCGKEAHRMISNTTFVLKGGGWYVTEYGNKKSDAAASGAAKDTSAAKPETSKPETPKTEAAPPAPAPAPAASSVATAP